MTQKLDTLQAALATALGDRIARLVRDRGEITITVKAADYLEVAKLLRDAPALRFEQLIDICGIDYSTWKDGAYEGPRFAAVSHLLSVSLNQRVRVRVFCANDEMALGLEKRCFSGRRPGGRAEYYVRVSQPSGAVRLDGSVAISCRGVCRGQRERRLSRTLMKLIYES